MRKTILNLLLLSLCNGQSILGSVISSIAFSFLVLQITHSANNMALMLAIKYFPLLLVPFVSPFIDRISLQIPLVLGDVIRGTIIVIIYLLFYINMGTIQLIFISSFIIGLIDTVYSPAALSIIPGMFHTKLLEKANSIISLSGQISLMSGFLLGGYLISTIGTLNCILIEGITYYVAAILFCVIKFPYRQTKLFNIEYWQELIEGIKIIYKIKIILLLTFLGFFSNIVFAFLEVYLPVYMLQIGKGANGYGDFMFLLLVGSILGSSAVLSIGNKLTIYRKLIYSLVMLSITNGILFFTKSFSVLLLLAIFLGLSLAILSITSNIILQDNSNDSNRAKILGTTSSISQCSIPISLYYLSHHVNNISINYLFLCLMIIALLFIFLFILLFNYSRHFTLKEIKTYS